MATETSPPSAPMLSIVVPAFNEAANIGPVIQETVEVLAGAPWVTSYEIIVVDDGSTDRTADELQGIRARYQVLRIVTHERNRGFGAALRSGYLASTGEAVTLLTSDGEVDPREVLDLFARLGDADLVLSRRKRDQSVATQKRTLLSAGFSGLIRLLLGFDPSQLMGVYVIRGSLVRSLELRSDTGLMNTELQMRCIARGCRINYGEMSVRRRLSGESKVTNLRAISRTFIEILKLRALGLIDSAGRRRAS